MMNLQAWALSHLSQIGVQNAKDIVSYLVELESENMVEEYLNAMLDPSNASDKNFINEFIKRFSEDKLKLAPGFYRKPNLEFTDKTDRSKSKSKEKERPNGTNAANASPISPSSSNAGLAKKKSKYVSLYSDEGLNKDVVLLPGRHKCNCQASKHKLVNNCMKCGRIVCEQEGSGPCSFCGNLVVSKEEDEILSRGSKKSEALHNRLLNSKKVSSTEVESKTSKGLQKAIEHKNQLLEFDKTSEKRTKVFDDESDYFQVGSRWINPADKRRLEKHEEQLREKRHDRSNRRVTIDLYGRKVIEEKEKSIYDPEDPIIKEILEASSEDNFHYNELEEGFNQFNLSRPTYVDTMNINSKPSSQIIAKDILRLQDREIQEMRDEGMCLSMHQPWASLLIAGIKKHEGRTWYSARRGRLWIASAAKTPTPAETSQLEQMYRILLKNENIKFPSNYPAGCLLGCVDVVDVLPQEEYRTRYPEGESDSPYVFVCENPQEMVIKFPIKGQHKIYKLDSKIHAAAKKALRT